MRSTADISSKQARHVLSQLSCQGFYQTQSNQHLTPQHTIEIRNKSGYHLTKSPI